MSNVLGFDISSWQRRPGRPWFRELRQAGFGVAIIQLWGGTPNDKGPNTDAAYQLTMSIEEGFDVFAPENVAPLVGYLASPAAEQVSGQVFVVYGGTVSVLAGPHREQDFQAEGPWTAEGLVGALGPFFETRRPIAGYVMPYE